MIWGGLINGLLVIAGIFIVITVIVIGLIFLFDYVETRKIKFVVKEIDKIASGKKGNIKKLKSCIDSITKNKMKN